ncbi:aa3-type cytochrome c oxidase subunit IV [Salipiger mucosus]|uniref:Cytochrome c oxidase subunit IV bacterial aa3 type domain-containing protein n=1 Tax=Salipiger mucosus DSM 16094 TaxID=1123237 RepID=S9RRG5_9RHOB|nr:aa3-type cytochrome c oxidase subunit IV [Salipiger mucosus]EPX76554.1 hypothetical protein Salmuc_00385 [Salipiger mucosus DSM 16094]
MADYKHGSMDITEQEKTFNSFITFTIRTVVTIIVLLLLLAMWNA